MPEAQLAAWSQQGPAGQSAETLDAISRALSGIDIKRYGRPEIFLQGSYAAETNTENTRYVDIVVLFRNAFYSDISALNANDREVYQKEATSGKFSILDAKSQVMELLSKQFGNPAVTLGSTGIEVAGAPGRSPANVVAACRHMYFYTFPSKQGARYVEGIVFNDNAKKEVVAYPRQDLANGEAKQQSCRGFKPVVRVFKNLAAHLVAQGLLPEGAAPSYFIESFIYNAPVTAFHMTLESSVLSLLIHWDSSRGKWDTLLQENQVHKLFGPVATQWDIAKAEAFVNQCRAAWDTWN